MRRVRLKNPVTAKMLRARFSDSIWRTAMEMGWALRSEIPVADATRMLAGRTRDLKKPYPDQVDVGRCLLVRRALASARIGRAGLESRRMPYGVEYRFVAPLAEPEPSSGTSTS
jgi:hypothetical protein